MDSARPSRNTPPPRRRTRTGCMTCRARKIKCDESSSSPSTSCRNCARARLDCVRPDHSNASLHQDARVQLALHSRTADDDLTQAGLLRKRTKRSCTVCRRTKKRCGGERPSCRRCVDKSLGCIYSEEESVPQAASPAPGLLSDPRLVRELCIAFFNEVAPLRCLGFLHRHTFLQEVDSGTRTPDDPLLLSVCALATKTVAMQDRGLWDVGCQWARQAQTQVFTDIDDISVHRIMCLVLLYEHAARVGEPRQCFLLSGMASRLTQALSLNLEYDHDVLQTSETMTAVERESRRRLMWACYILDTMLSCGLRDLQVLETSSIRIQLPCDDRQFVYKVAVKTAMVDTHWGGRGGGRRHNHERSEGRQRSEDPRENIRNQGIDAFLVRLYLIRDHVLQYINSDTTNTLRADTSDSEDTNERSEDRDQNDPWRLVALIADLDQWKESLTPELQFNADVIAVRKDESKLAALVSLHIMYHQVNCLLYRCTIPSMLFPARVQTGLSIKASPDFLEESRKGWFGHACAMSAIFEVSLQEQHLPHSMTDPAVAPSAYNAIIIKWLYLTNFVSLDERQAQLQTVLALVDIDLQFLQTMARYHPASVGMIAAVAERLVHEAKQKTAHSPSARLSETGVPVHHANGHHIAPDFRMNQLSTFARMRRTLPDVHAPDRPGRAHGSPGSASTPFSPFSPFSPVATHSMTTSPQSDQWAGDTERLWMWSE